jgi:hypothetical protein
MTMAWYRSETRPWLDAAQDLELVAQHHDLDLLGLAPSEDQHHEREHAAHGEVGEPPQRGTETVGLTHGEGAT